MAANAEIYFEHDPWGRALAWSAGLHVGVTAFLLIYSAVFMGSSGDYLGRGRWRRRDRRDPGQHRSAAGESVRDARTCWPTNRRESPNRNPRSKRKSRTRSRFRARTRRSSRRKSKRQFRKKNRSPRPKKRPIRSRSARAARSAGLTERSARREQKADLELPERGGDFGTLYAWYVQGDSAEGCGKLAEVRGRSQESRRRSGCISRSILRATAIHRTCRSNSPAACHRWTFPPCGHCSVSTLSGRCPRIIREARLRWSTGSITGKGHPDVTRGS